jgi:hypothetical protein
MVLCFSVFESGHNTKGIRKKILEKEKKEMGERVEGMGQEQLVGANMDEKHSDKYS